MSINKKFFCSFVLLFCVGFVSSFSGSGAGTAGDPFQITSWAELNETNDDLDATYKLMNDLSKDTTGYGTYHTGRGWYPIGGGNLAHTFIGNFEGNFKTISDLNISDNSANGVFFGLFRQLGNATGGATINNLGLINVSIDCYRLCGGFADLLHTGTINNSYVANSRVQSYRTGGDSEVGGLLGRLSASGGLIDNSYNYNTHVTTGQNKAGGLVGADNGGTVEDSWSNGIVTGSGGGLTGVGSATNHNNFWDNQTSTKTSGGLGTPKLTVQMKTQSTFTDAGWDFTNIWGIARLNINVGYPFLTDFQDITISLTSPINNTELLLSNNNFVVVTNSLDGLANVTMYINGILNETKLITGLSNSSTFSKSFGVVATTNINFEVCDVNNSCLETGNYSFDFLAISDGPVTYDLTTTEGLRNTFTTNQTVSEGYSITDAIFEYNSVNYTTSVDVSNNIYTISSTVAAPIVAADTNVSFRFYITSGGVLIPRTSYNQTVENLDFSVCGGVSNDLLLNMSLFDEVSKAKIVGDMEVNVEIVERTSGSVIENISTLFSGVNYGAICFSPTSTYSSYSLNLEVGYSAEDYVSELYHLQDADLIVNNTLSLYPLNSSSSTSFKVTYQDSTYNFVEGAILQLQRKYISSGTYEIVEAPITSSDGTATLHIDLNSVKYRVTVVKEGVVLDTFNNEDFQCESELTGECNKKLLGNIDPQNDIDYETDRDLIYGVILGNESITVSYSIPSSTPATVRIELTQLDQFGNETLCNKSLTSSSGSIECNYDATIGDSYIDLRIYKNGKPVGSETFLIQEVNGLDWLDNNYIIIVVLMLSLVGMAITSPEWIVINAIVTFTISGLLYLANGLNFVMGLGLIMWLFVAAVILIVKLSQKEDQ